MGVQILIVYFDMPDNCTSLIILWPLNRRSHLVWKKNYDAHVEAYLSEMFNAIEMMFQHEVTSSISNCP
jgi:hypothetical protein